MTDSEYRTYPYILEALKDLGWDTRNPKRGGSVYTQREFHKHDNLLTDTLGNESPENIILIPWESGHLYWVVEAKRAHVDLSTALYEAKKYADKINSQKSYRGGGQSKVRYRYSWNTG